MSIQEKANKYRAPGAPENQNEDYRVIATALDGHVRAVAIRSTKICAHAKETFDLSPVSTVALGRFMTGALILGSNLKNDNETITAYLRCQGQLNGMTVVCDARGRVKGYCMDPRVETTYHRPGKINISAAVGEGTLTVIRDLGLKEPYVGSSALISGEIAEDFAYYLGTSEQTKSIVSLGVLLAADGVKQAGGFMIQLMPGADERTIDYLEKRAGGGFPDITFLLEEGLNPEQILDMFLGDPNIQYLSAQGVSYDCDCSRERMERALIALGTDELTTLIQEDEPIELKCHFCDQAYSFLPQDLDKLLANSPLERDE